MRTWHVAILLGVGFLVFFSLGIRNPAGIVFDGYKYIDTASGNQTIIVPWYKWPQRIEPMRMLSYLIGNWYVMWAGSLALLFCLRRFCRSLLETLLVMLCIANLLQWAVKPQGCLYYYNYFPVAMFLRMAIPIALSRLPTRVYCIRMSVASVMPTFCVFVFCFARMAYLPTSFDCRGCWP